MGIRLFTGSPNITTDNGLPKEKYTREETYMEPVGMDQTGRRFSSTTRRGFQVLSGSLEPGCSVSFLKLPTARHWQITRR